MGEFFETLILNLLSNVVEYRVLIDRLTIAESEGNQPGVI